MSVQEIRVYPEEGDHKATSLREQSRTLLDIGDLSVSSCNVFYIEGVDTQQAKTLARELFTSSVTEVSKVGDRTDWDDVRRLEVALHPEATNRVASSIIEAAANLGIRVVAADTGTEFHFTEDTDPKTIDAVMGLKVNPKIERVRKAAPETLLKQGEIGPVDTYKIRGLSQEQLDTLSNDLRLVLDSEEMKQVQEYFTHDEQREPTDCELQAIAARWSDHCCHKTMNAVPEVEIDGEIVKEDPLFKQLKDAANEFIDDKEVLSAFVDNSGVIIFYDGMAVCIKLETHNGPLNIEPYHGAATGTGGVLRDIIGTGLGAKPILSIDIWMFAPLDTPTDELPEGVLSPRFMHDVGIKGVEDYGNRMGIPTANGSMHVDKDFRGKAGVLVGSLGIMREQDAKKREPKLGDLVVAVGAPTGRDGILGATMSSTKMDAQTIETYSNAVQTGDAIAEKKMQDAILEASEAGLISAITDCGAAGFSSAIGEMAENIGVTVDLSKAPLKYNGLKPWEIWLSESQERMVVAVDPANWEAFEAICNKHSTTVANLGAFDGSNRLQVNYGTTKVADLNYEFLNQGPPQKTYKAEWTPPIIEEKLPVVNNLQDTLLRVLAHGNIRSQENIVRRYDHEVQGNTVLKPYGGVHRDAPNDGVVLRPIAGKPYGLVTAHGLNPTITKLNPHDGTLWSIGEAIGNFVAIGGNPDDMAWSNNYIYPKPTPRQFGALRESVKAVCAGMRAFETPVITGKDSLSMTFVDEKNNEVIESPGTTAITVAGKIPDVSRTVTSDIKSPGSTLVLLGKADLSAMGGSVLYDVSDGQSVTVPKVNLEELRKTARGVYTAIQTGKVLAAHDVSEGGLAVTLAEMSFGGDCGVDITLPESASAVHHLFNETSGRVVLEVPDEQSAHQLFNGLQYIK
jgi:phosphoribosylformylglycinamidine synthase subunit PurSL